MRGRPPPPTPERVAHLLETEKQFTNRSDTGKVAQLYAAFFGEIVKVESLHFRRVGWGDAEAIEMAAVLPRFPALTTLDVGGYSLEFGEQLTRQTWSTSILFARRCHSADDVERMLYFMFDNTAAAVEEGRINVEGVAPEPMAETIASGQAGLCAGSRTCTGAGRYLWRGSIGEGEGEVGRRLGRWQRL